MANEEEKLDLTTGGCMCGSVRYEINWNPGFSFLCQCRRCQQATGGGHAPGFKIERAQLTVSGEIRGFERKADSGHMARHEFCPNCGSPLFSSTSRFPDSISVYAGSLDDPSVFAPQQIIHESEGQPWDRKSL